MSSLFIGLYLDEDVDVLLAELIRARGFTVLTTREVNQLGADDESQLAYAVSQRKTFFTHNRADFEALARLYLSSGQQHYGVIIAGRREPYELARRVLVLINQTTADEMHNQLRYL